MTPGRLYGGTLCGRFLLLSAILDKPCGTRRAQAETRQEDDATRGGFTARRSARGLGEGAHAAHLRRRWARI
nr:MAG TPA: hypothetical protein [Bacteriophage sp.]